MTPEQLQSYIFGGGAHPLAAELAQWAGESPRFRAFAETYRDKIRKKLRGAADEQYLLDLRCELLVARLLLRERSFALEYEKGGVGTRRAADFLVTFKTHTPLNVEVRRIRPTERPEQSSEHNLGKLAGVLSQKLGQLAPGMLNMLALHYDAALPAGFDAAGMLAALRLRAERGDDELFARRGFAGARDFLRHWARLHAVLFLLPQPHAPALWLNSQARPRIPDDLRRAMARLAI